MNIKKLVSAVSALAVAGSVFTGLAVTSYAAVTPYSQDYEDTETVDWTSSMTDRYTASIAEDSSNHYLEINYAGTNGSNGTTVATNENYTGKVDAGTDFTMLFDMAITCGNDQANTAFTINSSDGYILDIHQTAKNTPVYKINGNDAQTVNLAKGTWYKVQVTRSGEMTFLTIKDQSGDSDVFERATIASGSENGGITGMTFASGRYYANLKLDNIQIRDIEDGDVPSVIYNTVEINTAPYAKIVAGSTTVYSDYLGKASITAEEGSSESYTITKSGYTTATGKISFDQTKSITVDMKPSEDGVQFFEDFANAGISGGFYGTQTGSGGNNVWSRVQDTSAVEFIGGSSGPRDITVPLTYSPDTADIYTLTYDLTGLYDTKDTDAKTTTVTIKDANSKVVSTIAYQSLGEGGPIVAITVNGTPAETVTTTGVVEVKVDTTTNKATTTVSGTTSTIDVDGVSAPKTISINLSRNHRFKFDNIKVVGSASEVVTPEPVAATKDKEFTTNGDNASVWKATVSGISADDSYTKIVATAESAEKGTGTGSIDLSTEIKGKGSVLVYVVVPADDATSVKVTLE